MLAIRRLIEKIRNADRRIADRQETPNLAAYLWTNSTPVKHPVKDVSSTGFYLVTEERFYPGTQVMMTLQADGDDEAIKRSIAVESKAVRSGEDGVGLMFVLGKEEAITSGPNALIKADKKSLTKFLRRLLDKPPN